MTTYTNFDIIITAAGSNKPETINKVHFSLDNQAKDFPFDIFLEMLKTADSIEVQKWKPKAEVSGLNALLASQGKAPVASEDVPAF